MATSFNSTRTGTGTSDESQLETWIANERAQIHSAALSAMTEIGGLATDGLIERLNTPYPPASEADEDPHRRTGLLSAGVHYIVQDDTDRITVYVISSRDGDDPAIPWYLESGTATMAARNYMLRTQQEWEDRLAPEFENLFWGYYQ